MSTTFAPLPRVRSASSPTQPSFGSGPKWITSTLLTPPNSDTNEENEAEPLKRPTRHFAAFDLGFVPLAGTQAATEDPGRQKCYEELDEEPELPPTPCIKLKDGRELRPLLKHRKRSASHHLPNSAKWDTVLSPSTSSSSLSALSSERDFSPDTKDDSEHESEQEHPHVHFSDALENVCVFDESAPAHDSDPTHSPLEPPRKRSPPPPPSPRVRLKPLRLPGTVIASPAHLPALNFTGASPGDTPRSASPLGGTFGRGLHLKLACDSLLPSTANAPNHGMIVTQNVRLSADGKSLVGIARVRNVAFEKHVCIVYTADDWTTRREVGSRWTDNAEGLPPRPDGWDDFEFHVPLADLGIQPSAGSAVRAKILRFAVRYRASGQGEWWDNKDGANWVARFRAVSDF
ncbi:hypothetical protein FRC07_011649 [Ceratobasidium sp. 392]|nr:hypothetical protein FRC07_011649 [Ceratobasidium sp. 392]